ncbi:Zinc finger CCCH domain-containing protein 10 [Nymphon striatum]|nr:Zinc finger CCCH domain-containing protein 10 [Nymphon striatum]
MMFEDERDLWNGDDNVCRDFLRNVCRRGKNCKYYHPNGTEAEKLGRLPMLLFCHDFQNKECCRANCKFIHGTRQEEKYYHQTRELPERLKQILFTKEEDTNKGNIPICKDFLKGDCRRSGRCKYRHLSPDELNMELGNESVKRMVRRDLRFENNFDAYEGYDLYDCREYEPELKRRHFDDNFRSSLMVSVQSRSSAEEIKLLQEENMAMRQKLDALRKQVADLAATNEFLLEQNAQLRITKASTTVTQAPPPGLTSQQTNPAPVAPTIAQMSQTLPITANSADLTAGTLQPAQTLSVPVSLAQALAPVTLASVSIAQQLPASVSLTQSIPQSIITMSGSSPLVSYPIMTQSMRPPLPQSSLAH